MDEPRNPWPLAGGLSAVCGLVLVGGLLLLVVGTKAEPVNAPTAFKTFSPADKAFRCEYPDGWHKSSSSAMGIMSRGTFTKGTAEIEVESDLTGSLIGDMPAPLAGDMPDSEIPTSGAGVPDLSNMPGMEKLAGLGGKMDRRPAVEKLHEGRKEGFAKELQKKGISEFEEAAPKAFQSAVGDARWSSYTAKGNMLTGKVKGYRATIMGTERAIYVNCVASEKDWPKLDKVFQRVIGSISPGGA